MRLSQLGTAAWSIAMDGSGLIENWEVAGGPFDSLQVEVGVIGAGLAGAVLALVLARRGVRVAIADLHDSRRSDFRCEKFSPAQLDLLSVLGVRDDIEAAVGGRGLTAEGFHYETVVNAIRAAWPQSVRLHAARVSGIDTVDGWTRVSSRNGDLFRARVAVIAAGSGPALISALGFERTMIRPAHSFCLGFTLEGGPRLPADGLVHPGERAGDGVGFVSLFPIGDRMRVNLFGYHPPRHPWLQQARQDPVGAAITAAPGLAGVLEGARLVAPPELRFTDLYRTDDAVRPGVVLIGDAFQTSCPATGLGVTRLLTDVQRLADVHLPVWLAKAEVGAVEVAAFYADPVKTAVDRDALRRAERSRSTAVETGIGWRLRRLAQRVRRSLRRESQTSLPATPPHRPIFDAPTFAIGDGVEVRPASEILATLDADGRLDGLPFMPEMAALVGQRLRVRRLTTQTCVEGHGLRSMDDAVMLEAARCDGAAHDGCQRGCLMFWKTAWLRSVDTVPRPTDPAVEARALQALSALPTREGERYLCQSTVLAAATRPLPAGSLGLLRRNLRHRELTLARAAEILARAVSKRLLHALGRLEFGALKGSDGRTVEILDLQPGERVRIRSTVEIARTLDHRGKNRGMAYEAEMSMYAGKTFVVAGRVDRMIHEETGRMIPLKATVKLQGLNCQGRCALNCSRANPLYWREAWLERVD